MKPRRLKIGELARRAGLTVRALRHYEAQGLLQPGERSESGHRLYTRDDAERLHQIVSLRQLGFGLDQIRLLLEHPGTSLLKVVELQLAATRKQLVRTEELCRRLEALAARLRSADRVSLHDVLTSIEGLHMHQPLSTAAEAEGFFTPEQLARLKQRAATAPPGAPDRARHAWQKVFAELKRELDLGTEPSEPKVQALVAASDALTSEITGGDPGLRAGLAAMYRADPQAAAAFLGPGIDQRVFEYLGRARAK